MKLIKLGVISLLVLFVVVTCVGLLFPSTVIVSRAIDITGPKDKVLVQLKDVRNWKNWIEGMQSDRVQVISPGEIQLGNTHVKLTDTAGDKVVSEWISAKGELQTATMQVIYNKERNTTITQWQFQQKIGWYPWERFGSMMNDKILGASMEKNLDNLKKFSARE